MLSPAEFVPFYAQLEVKKCAAPLVKLFLAAVLAGYYVGSTKKQEKKIAELRKDIDDKR